MDTKRKHLLIVLGLCIATAVLYFPALQFGYVWDDWVWLHSLARYEGAIFTLAFLKPFLIGDVYWRPLAELTLYFQPGDKPQIFQHALNLAIHLCNILLLSFIGRRAAEQGRFQLNKWFYLLILFFALHPAFVETVAWVSARFDLLLTTFFLLGVLSLFGKDDGARQTSLVCTFFLLGLLVKESAVLYIPLFLGVLWLLNPEKPVRELIERHLSLILCMLIVLVLWLVVRDLILGKTGASFLTKNLGSGQILQKLYMVLSTLGAYALLLIFPFKGLSSLYPVDQMLANAWYAVAGCGYLVVMVALLGKTGDGRKIGVTLGLFLVSLLLVLNILDVGFADNLIQNRYLYPSFAVVLVCLFIADVRLKLTQLGDRAFSVLAVGWLALSVVNIQVTLPLWKDSDTLSRWLYVENPQSPYAANMRATVLMNSGYIEAAIETAGDVAVHKPTHGAYIILGDSHFMLGKCEDATVYYEYAYELGGFPIEKAAGLLGMYRLKVHSDAGEAERIQQLINDILKNMPDELAGAKASMEMYEKQSVECRDEE